MLQMPCKFPRNSQYIKQKRDLTAYEYTDINNFIDNYIAKKLNTTLDTLYLYVQIIVCKLVNIIILN